MDGTAVFDQFSSASSGGFFAPQTAPVTPSLLRSFFEKPDAKPARLSAKFAAIGQGDDVLREHFLSQGKAAGLPERAQRALDNFERRFARTGAAIIDAAPQPDASPATYVRFTYEPDAGGKTYTHAIFVQTQKQGQARNDIAKKFSLKHEETHALQDFMENGQGDLVEVPESFASPFNEASPVVMCVEDWVWKMVMTEGGAFAETVYQAALEEIAHPERKAEIRAEMAKQAVTLEDWDRCMVAHNGDVQAAKQMASTMWWDRLRENDPGVDEKLTILDHYVRYALWLYQISERLNPKFKHLPEEYVQIDRAKVGYAIGGAFGPNSFGKDRLDANFLLMPPISKELRPWLDKLIEEQGGPRESLRTFDQALAARGVSPETYVQKSKDNISWFVPKPKEPAHRHAAPQQDVQDMNSREADTLQPAMA